MKHSNFIKLAENIIDNDKLFCIQRKLSTSDISKFINRMFDDNLKGILYNALRQCQESCVNGLGLAFINCVVEIIF